MAKINFNSPDFDDAEILESSPAAGETALVPSEILLPVASPAGNRGGLSNAVNHTMAAAAGALNPVVSLLNSAIGAFTDISKCIAVVSCEKQRTKQVRAQADAQIEESRQQTKRVQIQQTEETRRFAAQCEKEIEINRIELEKLQEELQDKDAERRISHQTYIASLDTLEKAITSVASRSDTLLQRLSLEADAETLQMILQSWDRSDTTLVELSKQIVELRRR